MACYGHVRDLPKSQLGVDVDGDFAPTYEPLADRRKELDAPDRRGSHGRSGLARDRPRPRGRGDRVARRRARSPRRRSDPPRHVPRDHQSADRRGVQASARDRPGPGRTRSRRAASSTVSSATRFAAPVEEDPLRTLRRPRPVRRAAADRRPRARDPGLQARGVLDDRRVAREPRGGDSSPRELIQHDGQEGHIGIARPRRSPSIAAALAARITASRASRSARAARNAAPPFTTSTLQQEASRKLGFSCQAHDGPRAAALRGRRARRGRAGRPHHVHAYRLAARRRGRVEQAHDVIAASRRAVRPRASRATTRRRARARRRRTRRSARRISRARPSRVRRSPEARSAEALHAHLAADARVARWRRRASTRSRVDVEADRLHPARERAGSVIFDGFHRRLRRGAPTSRRRTSRRFPTLRRGRGAAAPGARARAALHAAAAALHRGVARQDARGARHRPSVDVRADDLDAPRARLRPTRTARSSRRTSASS